MDYQDFDDPLIDTFVQKTLDKYHTTGLAVAVVHKKKTRAKGYGFIDTSTNTPVTPRTLFLTASTTKSFTAALTAHVIESKDPVFKDTYDQPITWKTPIARIIPADFTLQDGYATSHLTLEDALSHRTGLPRHDLCWFNGECSPQQQVQILRHLPMHNEMRTTFEYTNLPFKTVAYAIRELVERYSDSKSQSTKELSLKSLYESWLFDPLSMNETFFDIDDARQYASNNEDQGVNFSRGFYYVEKNTEQFQVPWEDLPPRDGSGGIISNVLDYTKWVRHLMSKHSKSEDASKKQDDSSKDVETDKPGLTETTVQEMTTPRIALRSPFLPFHKSPFCYGLGLFIYTYKDHIVWQHNGAIAGYMSTMIMLPEKEWAVIAMQNAYSSAQDVLAWKLIDDFLDVKEDERFDMGPYLQQREEETKDKLQPENVRKRLFPDAPPSEDAVPPTLKFEEFKGVYRHPAYQSFRLHCEPSSGNGGEGNPPVMYLRPASKAYLDVKVTLNHVSGDWWWAYWQNGPEQWLVDQVSRLKFEIGIGGKLRGMWWQAEPAIDDMAWFDKVE